MLSGRLSLTYSPKLHISQTVGSMQIGGTASRGINSQGIVRISNALPLLFPLTSDRESASSHIPFEACLSLIDLINESQQIHCNADYFLSKRMCVSKSTLKLPVSVLHTALVRPAQ